MDSHEKGKLGEDFVASLASDKYLKYWCYPNPHDINGDKKEICDLLILFKHIAIIISVKSYFLKGDYERYKRKVIKKSTNQLYGAQRKLSNLKMKLILNHPDRGEHEVEVDKITETYLLTINTGEQFSEYELTHSLGGKQIVSVLNKETFDIIMNELDSISDLVEYLRARERLLSIENISINGEEKDLLAVFLRSARVFPANFNQVNAQLELQNEWENYITNPQVVLKRIENRSSYFIDRIVRNDILKVNGGKFIAMEFMSLNRFERRMLAKCVFELVQVYGHRDNFLARRYVEIGGIYFLLMYYHSNDYNSEQIDQTLHLACTLYHYEKEQPKLVYLGLTREAKQWKFGLSVRENGFIDEEAIELDRIIEGAGWFQNENFIPYREEEYPNL